MSSHSFADYVQDLLSPFGLIKLRRMFGGYGVYAHAVMMGLIVDDELYFKANKKTAVYFEQAGSQPFTYQRNEKLVALSYWKVPADVLDDQEQLKTWFLLAISSTKAAS